MPTPRTRPPHQGGPAHQQVDRDAQEPVHSHLDHDAGHQGRDVARGDRMRHGQPHVQRSDARLGAEAEERQRERRVAGPGGEGRRSHSREGGGQIAGGQQEKHRQEGDEAGVRDRDVPVRGADRPRAVVLGQHHGVGRERHGLPGHEEGQRVVGHDLDAQRQQQHVQHRAEQPQGVAPLVRGRVAEAVHRDRGADHPDDDEEERAQAVDPERELGQRQERRGHRRHDPGAQADRAESHAGQGSREAAAGHEPAPERAPGAERRRDPDRIRAEEDHEQEVGEASSHICRTRSRARSPTRAITR